MWRDRYIVGTLTSVDIQEIVRIGGKMIEVYEDVFHTGNFKTSLLEILLNIT